MGKRAVVLVVLFCAALAARAQAAEGAQSFKSLTAQGFEIKSVTLVPMEIAQRGNSAVNYDTVFVTLQKGAVIAVCYYSMVDWINADATSLDNTAQCQVR